MKSAQPSLLHNHHNKDSSPAIQLASEGNLVSDILLPIEDRLILLKGYTKQNPEKDYEIAKHPATLTPALASLEHFEDKQWLHVPFKDVSMYIDEGFWLGIVVPAGHIIVDIDDKREGAIVYNGLKRSGYHFICIRTPNGYQFVFEDTKKIKTQKSGQLTFLSCIADYRLPGKGYIVLPNSNTKNRVVIHRPLNLELSPMPLCFLPIRAQKDGDQDKFLGKLKEGGRNDSLHAHASRLAGLVKLHHIGLTQDEKQQILQEVNNILCVPPLDDAELSLAGRDFLNSKVDVVDEVDVIHDQDLIPAYNFPFEEFPEQLLNFINIYAKALHVKPDVIASIALAVISGAIGNAIRVSPKLGEEVPIFIWLIIIALSGSGKTPVLEALLDPVKQCQGRASRHYEQGMEVYRKQVELSKRNHSAEMLVEPKLRHYYVSDSTVEALSDIFASSDRGIIMPHDEISGLILGLNQYKSKGNDRQHYLELYSAGSWKVDRKTVKRFIHNTGAAIIGGIQPHIMTQIFDEESFDDGLLPRFLLISLEDQPFKFNRDEIPIKVKQYWGGLLAELYEIPARHDEDGYIKPQILTLAPKALNIWEDFYNKYGDIKPNLSTHAQVFIPKLVAHYSLKFAGIIHCLKVLEHRVKIEDPINVKTIKSAIILTNYFAGQIIHALKLYEPEQNKLQRIKRLVNVLYNLSSEVHNGQLMLSKIMSANNAGLAKKSHLEPRRIGSMLRELGLKTEQGTGGYYYLLWEEDKIQELFTEYTSPTSPTSTASIPPTRALVQQQEATNHEVHRNKRLKN